MSSKGQDKTKTPQKSGKKGFSSEQIMGHNLFLPDNIDEKNLKNV